MLGPAAGFGEDLQQFTVTRPVFGTADYHKASGQGLASFCHSSERVPSIELLADPILRRKSV